MRYTNYWYITEYLKAQIRNLYKANTTKEVQEEVILRIIRDWDLPSEEAQKIKLILGDSDFHN
ncbi:MAG: hypothetical protein PHQ54_01615 [Candidatus Omnitrophica bacterium]|nr:hypothetical protein [Candidatus Omnitrophota bacterium]